MPRLAKPMLVWSSPAMDPSYALLFKPLKIGPVTAPNRFCQVPHCTGMGYQHPQTLATMRGIKAEGGWGVVNTEYCSIHPSSDDLPAPFCSLWDDGDVRNMVAITDAVHAHGALAGVELWYGGLRAANHHSREISLAPVSLPVSSVPWQSQCMDLGDIAQYRTWHRAAVKRALQARFDIIYVYAAHTYLLAQFLDAKINQRADAYGGSTRNRQRLLREIIADTRELVDGKAALALRIEVMDEDGNGKDERSELLKSLSSSVDLFDVTIPDYSHEMGSSRFVKEATLEGHVRHVKALTGKPVVSVGRFTSPDTMLGQIKRGVVDLIGAARPSIADPFLPAKIREGRLEDIRECIGCNICYANDGLGVPIRCTQNPTLGEEWRRGWHPERVNLLPKREKVLIVGAGPAGLEAAVTLGRRGAQVMLADKSREFGGRINTESRLPGLSEWARVRDWRMQQIRKLDSVKCFPESFMSAADIASMDVDHILLATGSTWRSNGTGRSSPSAILPPGDKRVFTPDQIMADERPKGDVVIYDDDGYYMAAAIAELFVNEGLRTTFVTPSSQVAPFSTYTVEQLRTQSLLLKAGVEIITNFTIASFDQGDLELACVYNGKSKRIACRALVPVTSREPNDNLWHQLQGKTRASVKRIGDCAAPGLIVHAVYSGHRAAQELGEPSLEPRRERVVL